MKTPECPREDDVVCAVLTRRWPDQCDESLRSHAGQCEVCRDLVEVMSLLRDERQAVHEAVSVPAAGQVWWRAAIRARLEANRAVSRPLTWLFGTAGACAIGLAIASVGLLWTPVEQAVSWTTAYAWLKGIDPGGAAETFMAVARTGGLLALGAVACIVLAPLALYVVLSDE